MIPTRVAAIDIGTNAVQMRIAESADRKTLRTLLDRNVITGLGRGVDRTKRLTPSGIERALATLRDCASDAAAHNARIVAVGTSALRDATNAQDFTLDAQQILGAPIEIIDGAREADLTCRGALYDLDLTNACIVDIGGGSTEIIRVENGVIRDAASLDIGSVRLFERHLRSDPPSKEELDALHAAIEGALRQSATTLTPPLVALAGTATSVALIALGYDTADVARTHLVRLSSESIREVASRLGQMSLAERRALPSLHRDRADVIVAGSAILASIARMAGGEDVIVSENGVRVGLLLEAFACRSL